MKVVRIEILPAKDGEVVTAVITEQQNKRGNWEETGKHTVRSGTPEATRSMLLGDDERVMIEGKVEEEMVLDRDQFSARPAPKSDEAKKKQQESDEHQAKRFERFDEEDRKAQGRKTKKEEEQEKAEAQAAEQRRHLGEKPEEGLDEDEPVRTSRSTMAAPKRR